MSIITEQVLILFILITVGFVCAKTQIITDDAIRGITNLVLYAATPCVIINSFHREFDEYLLKGLVTTVLFAIVVHILNIVVAKMIVKDANESKKRVLQFGVVFSNCTFMSMPLQISLLGSEGAFYGAAYIAVFNVFLWTYGLLLMSGGEAFSLKKLILNPGIVAVFIGVFLFVFGIELPSVVITSIKNIAGLNTPLPMIVIGYYLARANLTERLKDAKVYIAIALRLIVLPIIVMVGLRVCRIEGTEFVSMIIAVSAPVAASCTMFAERFEQDIELTVGLVALSTIIAIFTMPIWVGIASNM